MGSILMPSRNKTSIGLPKASTWAHGDR
jgi:hypothetical protein